MYITLRQLEVFSKVHQTGSTIQASELLSLSQSAISTSLSELEKQLKIQLFDRVGKRLVINENGRLLYPKALAVLEQIGEIEQLFLGDIISLRIAASTTIGNYMLPEMMANYRCDFSDSSIELTVGNSRDVIASILAFQADVGFIEGPCHNIELVTQRWLEDELVVFASPNDPLAKEVATIESLSHAPWVLRESGSGTREVLDNILFSRLPGFRAEMELGNSEAIKHSVRCGIGISCLSRRVVQEQLNSGALVEVPLPFGPLIRQLNLVYHSQKHLSRSLMSFLIYCHFSL